MKYLKRFNEELNPLTYRRAASKLDRMGHKDRANALRDWSYEVENRENASKWKRNIKEYSPFGLFKLKIENPETGAEITGDFALDIHFDESAFEDNLEYEREINHDNIKGVYFCFFISIIPTTEESFEELESILPDPDFSNGSFHGLIFSVKFEINNGSVNLVEYTLDNYDENVSGHVSFVDRSSANRFKSLLKKILTDKNLGYPSGYTDADNIYDVLERSILIRQSFSSDYGFKLEDLASYINNISPNELYKS